jgi:hypothetical protein
LFKGTRNTQHANETTTHTKGTIIMSGMTNKKHTIAVDAILDTIETARSLLTSDITNADGTISKGVTVPPTAVIRKALEGIVAKRGKRIIRTTAPTFYDSPLASVLHRLIQYHRSSGSLWGVMGARHDARCIARWAFDGKPNPNGRVEKSGDPGIMRESYSEAPDDFTDQMDSVALVILNGQSRAADNWSRALGIK